MFDPGKYRILREGFDVAPNEMFTRHYELSVFHILLGMFLP